MIKVIQALDELNIPKDQLVVVGSGILGVKEIRAIDDIDLVVTEKAFDTLKSRQGWKMEVEIPADGTERPRIYSGIFEAFTWWLEKLTVHDFIEHPEWTEKVDDYMFLSLEELLRVKMLWRREKDLKDIELINEYLG